MQASFTHPVNPTGEESISERIVRTASLVGLVGFLGFLEYLQFVHVLFELAEIFYIFFLLFLIPLAAFAVNTLQNRFVSSQNRSKGDKIETEPHDSETDPGYWIEMGYEPSPLKTIQAVAMIIHPNVLLRGLLQAGGAVVAILRHGGQLPHPDTYESPVTYSPPFDGEWTVVNGSPDKRYSHSWFPVRQRYAYDFVITDDEGKTNDGTGGVDSFYCFDEPVCSPADGTVVRAKDGHRDYHRTSGWIDPRQYRLAGNYVVIKHAENEYSFLAHLRDGTICVSPGDQIKGGEQIGRCGHSGNSSEPHLHFHIQDHRIPYIGAGIPIQFQGRTAHPDIPNSKGDQIWVHSGQTLKSNS